MDSPRPVNPGRLFEAQLAAAYQQLSELAPAPGEPFDAARSLELDRLLVVAETAMKCLRALRGES